jgi:hypothetical protein
VAADRARQELAGFAPAEILIFVRKNGSLQTPRQRMLLQGLPLSALIAAEEEGQRLTEDELTATCCSYLLQVTRRRAIWSAAGWSRS